MSQLYIRLRTGFFRHKKTLRLKARIGEAAFWIPPAIWAWAAEQQPDGNLAGWTDQEIAEQIGFTGNASAALSALIEVGFLDQDRTIHDWKEHEGFHEFFSRRASHAAKVRWLKVPPLASPLPKEKEKEKEPSIALRSASSIASSTQQSVNGSSSKSCDCVFFLKGFLCQIYQRKPDDPWAYSEDCLVLDVSRRPNLKSECSEIEVFKPKAGRYFPQSVERLLTDWAKTVDRARAEVSNPNPVQPKGNWGPHADLDKMTPAEQARWVREFCG